MARDKQQTAERVVETNEGPSKGGQNLEPTGRPRPPRGSAGRRFGGQLSDADLQAHLNRFYKGEPRQQRVRTRSGQIKTITVRTIKCRQRPE